MSDDEGQQPADVFVNKLWRAVNQITQPTTRRVDRRDEDGDWLEQLATDPTITVCDVAQYRAATVSHGSVPSLWQQAVDALGTGMETAEGGSSPLRERSPADLDLMETMLTIRESMAWQLKGRGVTPRDGIDTQIRQLAAHVVTHEPDHVQHWSERLAQWARLLSTYLHALEPAPKPVRLRNAKCPKCDASSTLVDSVDGGPQKVAPPLYIDFTSDGFIRAAECGECHFAWWRGDDMRDLAAQIGCEVA